MKNKAFLVAPLIWVVGLLLSAMVIFVPPDSSGFSLRVLALGTSLMGIGLALGVAEAMEKEGAKP